MTDGEILASASVGSGEVVVAFPVEDFPQAMLPGGASSLELVVTRAADVAEFLAAVPVEGGRLVVDTLFFSGAFNSAKTWAWWDEGDGRMLLASQLPFRMTTFFASWEPSDEGFRLVEEWVEDPSADALEETLALLEVGRVEEAAEELFGVLYPGWYYCGEEMAARFLRASALEAWSRGDAGDPEGAIAVYLCAGRAYEQCGLDPEWFLAPAIGGEERNPVSFWMDDEELVGILHHLALTADAAGDPGLAARAREACMTLAGEEADQ